MFEKRRIVVLPGDGVGSEVMTESIKLLNALQEPFHLTLEFEEHPVGGESLRKFGVPLQPEVLERCKSADAVLLGTVGSPQFRDNPEHLRPEYALRQLRTGLEAYCNLRSTRIYNVTPPNTPLESTLVKGIDFVVIRGLKDGLYYEEYAGKGARQGPAASGAAVYDQAEIRRIARKACGLAQIRKRRITLVDRGKEDAETRRWNSIVQETAASHPDIRVDHLSLNDFLNELDGNPFHFDVILTETTVGEKVNEETGKLAESLGMLASACLGSGTAIYQPVHHTEADIAGKNIANPIAMMNSAALMMQYSLQRPLVAQTIEEAITTVLARGYHTADIKSSEGTVVGTREFAQYILEEIKHHHAIPFLTA